MLNGNQLDRYGAVSKVLPFMAPNAKVFFVGAPTLPSYQDYLDDFPVDKTGGNRTFPTLVAALADANVVTARGDVILILPGHTESISSVGALTISKAALTIIGIGNGDYRPTFTFDTATTATAVVSGAGTRIQNVIFDFTGIDAVAAPITVSAAGCSFDGCKFINATASAQSTLGIITTAAGTKLTLSNNMFVGTSDAGTTSVVRLVGGADHVIENNTFIGGYTSNVGAIENTTTACTNLIIRGNTINNLTASSTKAITLQSGTTGQIYNNRFQILSGTAPITGAAMSWVGGNYYAATIAAAGTLI